MSEFEDDIPEKKKPMDPFEAMLNDLLGAGKPPKTGRIRNPTPTSSEHTMGADGICPGCGASHKEIPEVTEAMKGLVDENPKAVGAVTLGAILPRLTDKVTELLKPLVGNIATDWCYTLLHASNGEPFYIPAMAFNVDVVPNKEEALTIAKGLAEIIFSWQISCVEGAWSQEEQEALNLFQHEMLGNPARYAFTSDLARFTHTVNQARYEISVERAKRGL